LVQPVVKIDGLPVGNGKPGPLTQRLRKMYVDYHMAHLI
jgi:D-alanine transaminase